MSSTSSRSRTARYQSTSSGNPSNRPMSWPQPRCSASTARSSPLCFSRSARTSSPHRAESRSPRTKAEITSLSSAGRRMRTMVAVKRYHVTTFGCQMNAHDSERIKGLLEELGLGEAASQAEADVLVYNTCTIREKPDTKFAAYMGEASARKRERPGTIIAVGGCYAEAQRERLFSLYPAVDVAFGPGTIPHLGKWLGAGG